MVKSFKFTSMSPQAECGLFNKESFLKTKTLCNPCNWLNIACFCWVSFHANHPWSSPTLGFFFQHSSPLHTSSSPNSIFYENTTCTWPFTWLPVLSPSAHQVLYWLFFAEEIASSPPNLVGPLCHQEVDKWFIKSQFSAANSHNGLKHNSLAFH